jgi:lysozyme family protein
MAKKIDRKKLSRIAHKISQLEGGEVAFTEADGTVSFNGLNQKTYNSYRRRKKKALQDVQNVRWGEYLDILEEDFVRPNGISNLPDDILPLVVDMSWNSGPTNAAKTVQRVVGAEEDGIIGPKTMKKLEKFREVNDFTEAFTNQRTDFILDSKDPGVEKFRNGILNRVEKAMQLFK